MNRRLGLLAAAGAVALVVAVGGTALAAGASSGGPVSSSGVITGCYTAPNKEGSSQLTLQNAGTNCPSGESAVSWSEQGPTGPQGPVGPQGATGPQGPAGPAGAQGAPGQSGPGLVVGSAAPGACANGGIQIDDAYSDVGNLCNGNTGPAGPAGPAGQPGAGATVASLASGDSKCPSGGASITDGNGNAAYACNGAGPGKYAVNTGTASGGQFILFDNSHSGPFDGYVVVGDCNDINTPDMTMWLDSYAFKPAQVWTVPAGSAPTYTIFQSGAGGEHAGEPTAPTDGGVQQVTWHVLDSSGAVTITAWDSSSAGTCTFTAEATGY